VSDERERKSTQGGKREIVVQASFNSSAAKEISGEKKRSNRKTRTFLFPTGKKGEKEGEEIMKFG